jgi:PhnB protein
MKPRACGRHHASVECFKAKLEHPMTTFTEFYVMPVKKARLEDYRQFAEASSKAWRAHGALCVTEYIAEDAKPGVHTSFPRSVKLEDDEVVAVATLVFRSREDCARIKAAVMKDPVFANMGPGTVPVDGKRMFWGGFKPIVGEAAMVPPGAAIQPYLFFRGRCEEAIEFYRKSLGAELLMMMRFKDNPEQPGPDKVSKAFDDKIMHAALQVHGAVIMMSDGIRSGPLDFQCMSLSLTVPTEAEAEETFNALAAGGTVQMPMGKTFFSPVFGSVADKFGVSWMITVPQPMT